MRPVDILLPVEVNNHADLSLPVTQSDVVFGPLSFLTPAPPIYSSLILPPFQKRSGALGENVKKTAAMAVLELAQLYDRKLSRWWGCRSRAILPIQNHTLGINPRHSGTW